MFLDQALARLLPQVVESKEYIEFIISDNASTDDTQAVIDKYKRQYPDIFFTTFLQETNTGQFGNFKKCRELASGEYFWLLSDNDYVIDGVLIEVIKNLLQHPGTGLLFLRKWVTQLPDKTPFSCTDIVDFNTLFLQETYHPTLISACIILNSKDEDEYLFQQFEKNSFIGFVLLIKAGKTSANAMIVDGPALLIDEEAEVKFDVLKSWIEDMSDCLDYLKSSNYVDELVINSLVNIIIKENIKTYYLKYKSKGKAYGAMNIKISELNKRIWNKFKKYHSFWISVFPYMLFPAAVLNFYVYNQSFKNFKKKIRKFISH